MRAVLLALLLPVICLGQTPDPLVITLPSGKVLHFESIEQKKKFEAGRANARETGLADEQAQRNRQAQEDEQRYQTYRAQKSVAARAEVIFLYIQDFDGPWTIGSAHRAVETSPGSDKYRKGDAIEGTVYVEWTPAKDTVNGAERAIIVWECGVIETGGRRYKRYTTSPHRAYDYFTSAKPLDWPPAN